MSGGATVPEVDPPAGLSAPAPELPDAGDAVLVRLRGRGLELWDRWSSSAAVRASGWHAFQYGTSMALRFLSNVLLAHLIVDPGAFGLINMGYVVLVALAMFSDFGLGQAIVQQQRGEEPDFVNTAWTMQVARGVVLWLLAAAAAWPMAWFFRMPELLYLLPVLGFKMFVEGFDSTLFWTMRRHLKLRRVVTLELVCQIIGTAVMLAIAAWFFVNKSALTAAGYNLKLLAAATLASGALLSATMRMLASHLVLQPGFRNRFRWEPEAFRVIFHFGKWIFLSTFLAFFAQQMDRLLVGKLLGDEALGVYGQGQNFATFLPYAVIGLGAGVVFPLLSRVARERPEDMSRQVLRVRRVMLLPSLAGLSLLILGGDWLIWAIYPRSFHDAGWTLQILAIGACGMLVSTTYGNAMLAQGRSRELTVILLGQISFLLAGSLLGYYLLPRAWPLGQAPPWAPMAGLVGGFALTEWLNYPIVAWRARIRGIWNPRLDGAVFFGAAVAAAAAYLLVPSAPDPGMPPVEGVDQIQQEFRARHALPEQAIA